MCVLGGKDMILFAVDDDIIGGDGEGSARQTDSDNSAVAPGDFKGRDIGWWSGAGDETDVNAVSPRNSIDFLLYILDRLGVQSNGRSDTFRKLDLFFIDIEPESLVTHSIGILNSHMSFC
jgi:hypothetical protein